MLKQHLKGKYHCKQNDWIIFHPMPQRHISVRLLQVAAFSSVKLSAKSNESQALFFNQTCNLSAVTTCRVAMLSRCMVDNCFHADTNFLFAWSNIFFLHFCSKISYFHSTQLLRYLTPKLLLYPILHLALRFCNIFCCLFVKRCDMNNILVVNFIHAKSTRVMCYVGRPYCLIRNLLGQNVFLCWDWIQCFFSKLLYTKVPYTPWIVYIC